MGVILIVNIVGNIIFIKYYMYYNLHKIPTINNIVYLILNSTMMYHQHIEVFYCNYMIVWYIVNHPSAVIGSL